MRWFLAAMLMLTLLTLMVSDHNAMTTCRVETDLSYQQVNSGEVQDQAPGDARALYLLAAGGTNGDENNNGDEGGDKKELEADPAGGIDRIWNAVQNA